MSETVKTLAIDLHGPAAEYVQAHGREFIGIKLPKGYRKRRAKECYFNAMVLALEDRGQYVEGYVIVPPLSIPIRHAWVTLDGVRAIDPTLPEPEKAKYFGVPIDIGVVARRALENNRTGFSLINPLDDLVKQ